MKRILTVFLLLIVSGSTLLFSQSNFTILCVAAHPDDEDGATLAYYSKLKGYNAYTIFYTRGEGGQNEIGPELYDALGRIREQECYDAAKIQGSTPFFLGELDFGFSKTAKETFRFWGGEDSVLARIVYMVRVLQPDVIISNHDTITTKPNRQHGNHQAVGITIYEAFEKAADPNYHPEQLTGGLTTWQAKKLFFRARDSVKTDIVEIDISQKDASGKTIREITDEALSQHRTQGMDKVDKNSPFFYANKKYELVRSDKMYPVEGNDLFAGLVPVEKNNKSNALRSYSTYYNYKTVDPIDSLRILGSVKYNPGAKIGLIKTYDNNIENILKAFQIQYDTISANDLGKNTLSNYSTVIIDIRAYLYRPDLVENNNKVLDYVYQGGNVVCFYNKPGEWNVNNFAPYPLYVTSERVTEEDAAVRVIAKENYLLHTPNEITQSDWNNWVQERNIYLPSGDTNKTSARYERILDMNDENDPVPPTSLLSANYGKGTYVYCSLALYRQLKIFNEGASKLFMNLIARQANWDGGIRK